MNRSKGDWRFLATILSLALTGCGGESTLRKGQVPRGTPAQAVATIVEERFERYGVSPTEIVVGSCAPLTGQMSARGSQVVGGGRDYFNYVNEMGGVHGRKIKLISCDDKYDVDAAVECFNQNLKGKVFLATLFQGSASAAKYLRLSEGVHMPTVGFSTGADFLVNPTHRTVFQVRASYADEADEQVRVLWNDLGRRKIAVVYQNDAFGAACLDGIKKALQKINAEPIATVSYVRLTHDVKPIIDRLKEVGPDAVIIGGAGDALAILVKARAAIGKKVVWMSFSSGTDLIINEAGKAADNILITQVVPITQKQSPTVKLYESLAKKYEHAGPTASGLEGFIMAMTVVEGLKRTGKDLTRDRFIAAMESIHDFDIGLGSKFKLNFSPRLHDGFGGLVYWTEIKNGKLQDVASWSSYQEK